MKVGAPGTAGLRTGAAIWRSRGYLPHFEQAGVVPHVTFRLADSLPREVSKRMEWELGLLPAAQRDLQRRKRIEELMDAGHGSCVLRRPEVAELVENALLHFDGDRYRIIAWVVMPNHVHVLFEMVEGWGLAEVVASWKRWTAGQILKLAGSETGDPRASVGSRAVWYREYWDRFVRNERHLQNVVEYIHHNPIKAGLVKEARDFSWSSARMHS